MNRVNREVWEYMREGQHRVIREWVTDFDISVREQAKLDVCVDRLRTLDFALVSKKLLAGPLRGGEKLYKLRVRCENRELRPFLCRGPVGSGHDYTFLQGAIEVDSHRLNPSNAETRASEHRGLLIQNPRWRGVY